MNKANYTPLRLKYLLEQVSLSQRKPDFLYATIIGLETGRRRSPGAEVLAETGIAYEPRRRNQWSVRSDYSDSIGPRLSSSLPLRREEEASLRRQQRGGR